MNLEAELRNQPALDRFKAQSSIILLFLHLVTLGIYTAVYMHRQALVLDSLDSESPLAGFSKALVAVAVVNVLLVVAYVFIPEGHPVSQPVDLASDWGGRISFGLAVVWGFEARKRIHALLSSTKEDGTWFHGFWTFFFSPLYFNIRINRLKGYLPEDEVGE